MYLNMMRATRSSAVSRLDASVHWLDGAWLNQVGCEIGITAHITPRFRFVSGMGGAMWWPIQALDVGYAYTQAFEAGAGISAASAIFKIGKTVERPLFELTFGFFPITNNPDGRDFGGYLFKTAAYPPFLLSGAGTTLAGLKLNNSFFEGFSQDLVLSMEERYFPFFDGSIAYMASYNIKKGFELGGGIMLYHLLPFRQDLTNPKNENNVRRVVVIDEETGEEVFYSYAGTKASVRFSFDPTRFIAVKEFKKDELKFYGELGIVGFKNYPLKVDTLRGAGGVVTGFNTRGYPVRSERMPVMLGFNAPTHPLFAYGAAPLALSMALIGSEPDSFWTEMKPDTQVTPNEDDESIMDTIIGEVPVDRSMKRGFNHKPARTALWIGGSIVAGVGTFLLQRMCDVALGPDNLNVEVEYFAFPYFADANDLLLPQNVPPEMEDGHQDDWKWAVTIRKDFFGRVTVFGKAASDHLRKTDPSWWWKAGQPENLMAPNEWYWQAGAVVRF